MPPPQSVRSSNDSTEGNLENLDSPQIPSTASLLDSFILDQDQQGGDRTRKERSITLINGLALVLGLQIGSGIFSVPSQVSRHVSSPGVAILVWFTAGILVWTGAASFVELGTRIPENGGIQQYLKACYGDFYAFLFSWIWLGIVKPCALAMISIIFADNVYGALGSNKNVAAWQVKFVAVLGLSLITLINCSGTVVGARVANAFLGLKLLAILSIIVIGLIISGSHHPTEQSDVAWFGQDPDPQRRGMHFWMNLGELITAIYGALFCYGGWETSRAIQIGFVAGEMADPSRDLPRVINLAMCVAISSFILLNFSLFMVVGFQGLREKSTVAVEFGLYSIGPIGKVVYSIVVSLSCLGSLNANVFASGRLMVAASESQYMPRILGNRHCLDREMDHKTTSQMVHRLPFPIGSILVWFAANTEALRWDKKVPIYAMICSMLIGSFNIAIGTFDSLVTFVGISEYLFFLLAVIGLFELRRRDQTPSGQLRRTYTANPIIFCVFSGFIVLQGIITKPLQGLAISIVSLLGWGIFRYSPMRLDE